MPRGDFEYFLQDKHAAQYVGLDDEMPENYEEWLSDLDIYDLIEWANEYAKAKSEDLLDVCQHLIPELRRKVVSGGMETTVAEACGMDLLLVNAEQAVAKAGVKS